MCFVTSLSFAQSPVNAKAVYFAGTGSVQLKDTSTYCTSNPCPIGTMLIAADTNVYIKRNKRWVRVGGGGGSTLPTQNYSFTDLTGTTTGSDSLFYSYPQSSYINNSGQFMNYGDSFVHSGEWTGIVGNAFGFSSNNSGSFGGIGYNYSCTRNYTLTGWSSTHTFVNSKPVFVMAGLNDIRRNGATYKTLQKIIGCQTAIIANTSMQNPVAANNGSVTATGTWTTTSGIGDKASISLGGLVRKSGASGSTLTWTFGGTGFVFGFFNTDEVTFFSGNGTYSIDGGTPIPFTGKGKTDGVSDGITANAITQNAIIVNNLNSATHTVVITALETAPLYIDYFGIIQPVTTLNPIYFSSIPYLTSAGYALVPDQGSISASNSASKSLRNTVLRYSFANLPVNFVEVNDYYDTLTDVSIDNVHPNASGYGHIATAFLNNMRSLTTTLPFVKWDSLHNVTTGPLNVVGNLGGGGSNYLNVGGLQIFSRQTVYKNGPALELENDSGTSYVTAIDRGATFVPLTIRSGDMQIRPNNSIGTSGQVLTTDGTKVSWQTPSGVPSNPSGTFQYNNSGAFGATSTALSPPWKNLTWDNTNGFAILENNSGTNATSFTNIEAAGEYQISTGVSPIIDRMSLTADHLIKQVGSNPFTISNGIGGSNLALSTSGVVSGTAGTISAIAGNGLSSSTNGGVISLRSGDGGTNGSGGALTIVSGAGNGTGIGGDITIQALTGGAHGGDITLSSNHVINITSPTVNMTGTSGVNTIGNAGGGSTTIQSPTLTLSGTSIGMYTASPTTQGAVGTTLVNNVTAGGTTGTIADFTSLSVYATDAATIRNDIYQLALKVATLEAKLKLLGAVKD